MTERHLTKVRRRLSSFKTGPPRRSLRKGDITYGTGIRELMSFVVLAVGTVVVLSFFAFAGRLIGFGVMGLWSAGTAYFFMAPVYSFRVSNSRDLAALALYGTVGLVLARTTL